MNAADSKYEVRVAARNWAQSLIDDPPVKVDDQQKDYRALQQLVVTINLWDRDEKQANRGYTPDMSAAEKASRARFARHWEILDMLYSGISAETS